ncbi:bifunctional ADP-dependent NAD(P)H-hydrate dehydratase/NAD(P)H-hydrate epimerase [Mucilaginibacter hurinus]|uniref:Bifunctional NAD(P)H-hydrate repair enzyme n=1 Tax=Mucilaginibacter hurinus TaxID=2201324 RepID=A0A367GPX6_9SPHI|nr:NAD(P)H-hydrate dehydratase [Mucilaginibacter hurinus]RCH55512.1 bifunctional ADP-dependent NAD(P)H-hydrate dehydratase/NAD(P)H-hydrate epimerase [Mucilaginibacter hurinus]
MLPLLTSAQIREADAFTIASEPVASIDLMERAARAFVGWFINHFPDRNEEVSIYCGMGNNGGDGLAIARMLHEHGYSHLKLIIARYNDKSSADFIINLQRIQATAVPVVQLNKGEDFSPESSTIIIDALLGSGLNKALDGDFKRLVEHLNNLSSTVVAVDIPTGFFADGEIHQNTVAIRAELVITFQQAKINFLLPEAAEFIRCWQAVNIGISESFTRSLNSPYQFIEEQDIKRVVKPRGRFSNKGTYGHSLIIAGAAKTMGAALLCAAGCVYAGSGLTTACIPLSGLTALNSYLPEIMALTRDGDILPDIDWARYKAIAIGPGLGTGADACELLAFVLSNFGKPLVIDADGINLLANRYELWESLTEGSILTPHMKEFDRLFGDHHNWWARLQTARQQAIKRKIYIVLKNDYTITATPQGKLYFNSTGNAAMATGGMGDVLTGLLTSLIAQGYTAEEACLAGIYIHGKAGDELALPNRMNVVLPGRLAQQLPLTMAKLMA